MAIIQADDAAATALCGGWKVEVEMEADANV